jgi:hypothetical protein
LENVAEEAEVGGEEEEEELREPGEAEEDEEEEESSVADSDDIFDNVPIKAAAVAPNYDNKGLDELWDEDDKSESTILSDIYCNYQTHYKYETVHTDDIQQLYLDIDFNEAMINIAMHQLTKSNTNDNTSNSLYVPCNIWLSKTYHDNDLARLNRLQLLQRKCIFLIVRSNQHWFSIQLLNMNNLGVQAASDDEDVEQPFMVIVDSKNTVDSNAKKEYLTAVKRYVYIHYSYYSISYFNDDHYVLFSFLIKVAQFAGKDAQHDAINDIPLFHAKVTITLYIMLRIIILTNFVESYLFRTVINKPIQVTLDHLQSSIACE